MQFRCTFGEADLCFFGGVCANRTSPNDPQECVCKPGYSRDNTVFHDPNCALPDYALLGFFVEYTVIALALAGFYMRERITRGKKNRRLANFVIFCLICSAGFALALWLENGLFEGTLTMLALVIWSFLRSVVEVTGLFFSSASSIAESRQAIAHYRRLMIRSAVLLELGLIAMGTTLIVLCRTDRYNLAYTICMFILASFNFVLIGLILREMQRLNGFAKRECDRLPSGNEVLAEKWQDFIRRLFTLRLALSIYSGTFLLGLVAVPVLHLIIGSAPFGWVFMIASIHVVFLSCASIYLFMRHPMDSRNSFFAIGENMDSEEVTAYRSMFGMRTPIMKGRFRFSISHLISSRAPATNVTNIETYESSVNNVAQ